ncbi:hypothetical protein NADFUDRAFT_52270 [Nadsonia fulvescens var. elongata DSM 6958]|uniref:CBS domain-containing protein n=1 Tax=Nadsonia fulvescens var. elongata DSM 6958 TaxID=857566 RepID=A0A1E3PGV4_9ASCO|nr:hypothetical protein NADFUDRAFT_52270 [Nadsonia fulvescens var. elongata DSM 6958]
MSTDYRGAVVEDLDLPPAFTITPNASLFQALELSYERSYSYLPVVSEKTRSLLGYLTADQLRSTTPVAEGEGEPKVKLVKDYYNKFTKSNTKPFRPITPETPLEVLEKFFASGEEFAVITDSDKRFVLGVAVKEDLDKFISSRPSVN